MENYPIRKIGSIYVYDDKNYPNDIHKGLEIKIIEDCGDYYEAIRLDTLASIPFRKNSLMNTECLTERLY
jgi:hypothetical protein